MEKEANQPVDTMGYITTLEQKIQALTKERDEFVKALRVCVDTGKSFEKSNIQLQGRVGELEKVIEKVRVLTGRWHIKTTNIFDMNVVTAIQICMSELLDTLPREAENQKGGESEDY